MSNFFLTNRKKETGVTLVESTVSVLVLFTLIFGGLDMLTMLYYSSIAQSLAVSAGGVGSVPLPDDTWDDTTAPTINQLKINTSVPYLAAYVSAKCANNSLSLNNLKTLNLILGLAKQYLGKKAKTASNWITASDVKVNPLDPNGKQPLPGELVVFPVNCNDNNANFTTWRACVTTPTVFINPVYVCYDSTAYY